MTQRPRPPAATLSAGTRLQALDILRGLVIVIMALDHIRDYTHESGYAYDPVDYRFAPLIVYLSRWITHFCAPTFVFLAGVSMWLQAAKGKNTPRLSAFLIKRGLWIVLLEATVISFGWAFTVPYLPFFQVMWAIGWCMVAMAALAAVAIAQEQTPVEVPARPPVDGTRPEQTMSTSRPASRATRAAAAAFSGAAGSTRPAARQASSAGVPFVVARTASAGRCPAEATRSNSSGELP